MILILRRLGIVFCFGSFALQLHADFSDDVTRSLHIAARVREKAGGQRCVFPILPNAREGMTERGYILVVKKNGVSVVTPFGNIKVSDTGHRELPDQLTKAGLSLKFHSQQSNKYGVVTSYAITGFAGIPLPTPAEIESVSDTHVRTAVDHWKKGIRERYLKRELRARL